jgi:hypothetical protein
MAQASSAAGAWRGASAGVLPPAPARTAARSSGRLRRLASERGSAVVDFAILGPALVLLLVMIVESAMLLLTQFLLQTAVGDAARAGIVGSAPGAVSREALVREMAERVAGSLIRPEHLQLETLVYPSFDDIGRPEPFVDVNGNGVRDPGEPFRDVNGNGRWDADMGRAGLGGPNDVVLYRVRYLWQPMTPLLRGILPDGGRLELRAAYAVRNEPYPEG